ncbi:hypothetical protein ACFLZU_04105 [Thermodesulfobacteriota bacterium]
MILKLGNLVSFVRAGSNKNQGGRMFFSKLSSVFVLLILVGCVSGSAIITGTQRPAISADEVRVYSKYPGNYEVIAFVKSEAEEVFSQQDAVNRALQELKSQAAKVGANGIVLQSQGEKSEGTVGTFIANGYGGGTFVGGNSDYQTISAEAIYTE